jgi:hypothetical protein
MSFIVGNDGSLEVGPPPEDDPTRRAHARLVAGLAHELEMTLQACEAYDAKFERLEARIAFLEALLLGERAA